MEFEQVPVEAESGEHNPERAREAKKELDELMLPLLEKEVAGYGDVKDDSYNDWVKGLNKILGNYVYADGPDAYLSFVEFVQKEMGVTESADVFIKVLDKGGRPLQEAIVKFLKEKGNSVMDF